MTQTGCLMAATITSSAKPNDGRAPSGPSVAPLTYHVVEVQDGKRSHDQASRVANNSSCSRATCEGVNCESVLFLAIVSSLDSPTRRRVPDLAPIHDGR
jgi:hypothetical protein